MSEWERVRFSELAADEKSAISKPYGSAFLRDDYVSDGIPVVRGVNLASGLFHDDDFVYISRELANRMPGACLVAGDLVVTHRGTLGQVSMIPRQPRYEKYVASTSHVKVRLDPAKAFPEFYYYWFRSTEGQSSILAHASAVGVPGIAQPVAAVKSFRVPRPPLHTQRAIAEILGALDAKIGANDRVIRVTDELAATLTRAASDGRTVQLATIAEVVMGSSPPGTSYNEKGEGVPFYQGVRDFGARFPERRVWTTSPVRVAISGDTLISVRAPVGRANLANERMCIGRGVASLRSRNGHPYTLFHQVRLASDAWAPYEAEGTVFGSINKRQLEAITVCAIGSGGDDALEERLAAVEQRIAAALVESRQLAKTRDDLSPLLMSGRIRVRDAEKVAEEVV